MSTATRQYMPPNGRLQTTNLVRNFHPQSGRFNLTIHGLATPVGCATSRRIPARDDEAAAGNATSLEYILCNGTAR